MGSLTALDIVVLVLVLGGAVLGFARGLVQEVTSLLAWVLAILAVRFFHATLTGLLADYVGTPGGSAMLAFVLLFGGVFAVARKPCGELVYGLPKDYIIPERQPPITEKHHGTLNLCDNPNKAPSI